MDSESKVGNSSLDDSKHDSKHDQLSHLSRLVLGLSGSACFSSSLSAGNSRGENLSRIAPERLPCRS